MQSIFLLGIKKNQKTLAKIPGQNRFLTTINQRCPLKSHALGRKGGSFSVPGWKLEEHEWWGGEVWWAGVAEVSQLLLPSPSQTPAVLIPSHQHSPAQSQSSTLTRHLLWHQTTLGMRDCTWNPSMGCSSHRVTPEEAEKGQRGYRWGRGSEKSTGGWWGEEGERKHRRASRAGYANQQDNWTKQGILYTKTRLQAYEKLPLFYHSAHQSFLYCAAAPLCLCPANSVQQPGEYAPCL